MYPHKIISFPSNLLYNGDIKNPEPRVYTDSLLQHKKDIVDMDNICYVDARTGALPKEKKMKKLSVVFLLLLSISFMGCLSTPDNDKKEQEEPKEIQTMTLVNQCNWKLNLKFIYNNDWNNVIFVDLGKEPKTIELYKDCEYEMVIIGAYDVTPHVFGIRTKPDKDVWIYKWDTYSAEYATYSASTNPD